MLATAAALALLLGAVDAEGGKLPGAPARVYTLAWKKSLALAPLGDYAPQEPGGPAWDPVTNLVVVGTRDGWLHALRPDGSVAWEFKTEGIFVAEPAIDGETVYVPSTDGRLYALAVASGRERWRYDAKEELGTRPLVVDGTVFVASLSDNVIALDAATGAWRWHHRREPRDGFTIRGAASVVAAAGLVFAGYSDGTVSALEPANGRVRWERQVASTGDYLDVDSLATDGSRIFAASYAGTVMALDAATGKPVWQQPLKGAARLTRNGAMLYCTGENVLAAYSTIDGRLAWSTDLRGQVGGEPRVAGRMLLVPTFGDGLRVIEAASGKVVRVLEPGPGVLAPPIVAGWRVYVLSNGGVLFAVDVS